MNDHPSEELSEYLLDFQAAYIKNVYKRRKSAVSLSNTRHARLLTEIWQAANIEHIEVAGARRWKKIGFSVSVKLQELLYAEKVLFISSCFRRRFHRESLVETGSLR
jgi:engulfment/cell motility protein 1